MNPGGFPNLTNPDGTPMFPCSPNFGGPPMFPGGRPMTPALTAAFYKFCQGQGIDLNYGDEVYRPVMETQDLGTPGTHGSSIDPNFNTDEYELSDMEPSNSPPEEAPAPQARTKGKGKGKAPETSQPPKRQNYTPEESMVLARCWVDISEDPIFANNQRVNKFWGRIEEKYNALKPERAKERNADQLRKHWNRVKADVAKFSSAYHNTQRMWGSGQSLEDIRDKAMKTYSQNGIFPEFKYYDVWLLVKDLPKFQAGLEPSGPKRTKLSAGGSYTSSGAGDDAVDLTSPTEESFGTHLPTESRPIGVKAAKRKGKAKATATETHAAAPLPEDPNIQGLVNASLQRTLLDTVRSLSMCQNEEEKKVLQLLVNQLTRQLGLN